MEFSAQTINSVGYFGIDYTASRQQAGKYIVVKYSTEDFIPISNNHTFPLTAH